MFRPRATITAVILTFAAISTASAARTKKPHYTALGAARTVPYSVEGDPAGAKPDETKLRIRPLVVNGTVKDWTTGEIHQVTDRTFTVRRAVRLNDSLPTDKTEHWVWQRGPWLLVDRTSGRVTALRLPDYNPAVSDVVWFRDYAAYCGISARGKGLYAVVAQLAVRKPVLSQKLGPWDAAAHPTAACGAAVWQREPLQVSFSPTGDAPVTFNLAGSSAVLVEDGDPAPSTPTAPSQ